MILADEPIASLDPKSSEIVFDGTPEQLTSESIEYIYHVEKRKGNEKDEKLQENTIPASA